MRLALFLFLAVIFMATFASAQPAKITRNQYFAQLDKVNEKTEAVFPRRVERKREEFADGNQNNWKTETIEYAAADRIRHSVRTMILRFRTHRVRRLRTDEYIQIGKNYFCKEGSSDWKKSRTPCESVRLGNGPQAETEEYTVDSVASNGQAGKIFRMYETWTFDGIKWDLEQIFTVDSQGKLEKFEVIRNKVEPKEVVSKSVETYEYNIPAPMIKAPIK